MKYLLLIAIIITCSCNKTSDIQIPSTMKPLTGFNLKWRNLPPVSNQQMINNIKLLKPKILRYPGGSITHDWNWQAGLPTIPLSNDVYHPITDLKLMQQ